MSKRPLKYQEYLSKYNNCPPSTCRELKITCYRWVHSPVNNVDFYPLQLIPGSPPREFDNSDKQCSSYGLSLHSTLSSSKKAYLKEYNKRVRESGKLKFKQTKGDYIAELNMTEEDGIQTEANDDEHFTFYQYEECNFLDRVICLFNNFVLDGSNSNI